MIQNSVDNLTSPIKWSGEDVGELTAWAESDDLKPRGLTLDSYSSVRLCHDDPLIETSWAWPRPLVDGLSFGIEQIPRSLEYLQSINSNFDVDIEELDEDEVRSIFRLSCRLIEELSPPLFCSVQSILRSLHLVASPDDDIDVSFSIPHLPYSIFLSIPQAENSDAVPRLAESIVHEVLHLQLSLIERIFPLTRQDSEGEYAYSPWRNELRPIYGLIHGLFVFRTLEIVWSQVGSSKRNDILNFAKRRIVDIRRQCSLIEPKEYKSLTRFGQKLFLRLADLQATVVT